MEKIDKNGPNGCWIWKAAKFENGYGAFRMNGQQMRAHRVSWLFFRGEIPPSKQICHTCDNHLCVNPDHLWAGTQSDNMRDMARKQRGGWITHPERVQRGPRLSAIIKRTAARGERSPKAKLKTLEVFEIRRLYSLGVRVYILAKMFRTHHNTLDHIVKMERRVSG